MVLFKNLHNLTSYNMLLSYNIGGKINICAYKNACKVFYWIKYKLLHAVYMSTIHRYYFAILVDFCAKLFSFSGS